MAPGHAFRGTPAHRARLDAGVPRKRQPARSDACRTPPPAALLRGIDEFNAGKFFEQHETLEAIWIAEADPVRYLYQGILQVGVGFYHWRRGNWKGAVAKLAQGLSKLEAYRPDCQTIDVESLIETTRPLLLELQRRGASDLLPFPESGLPRIQRVRARG
ncbi:MAG TPA: DUF309 domain-containing protein [Candidatus Limnocylindrales bacterium]|nr:DUF309 domain-containing protein [Candidatus Limnocylindrales bacterium]